MDAALVALDEGATVVTANKRLARSIRHAANERRHARGLRAWTTPAVLPWRAWVGALWSQSLAAGGLAGRLDLVSDVQSRVLWRAVVRAADLPLLPGAAYSVAEIAGRAWRRSRAFGLPPDRLLAAADSDDAQTFAALAAAYQLRCDDLGCADAEMLVPALIADLEAGSLHAPPRLHAAGFEELTPLERELFAAFGRAGSTLTEEDPAPGAPAALVQVACRNGVEELELAARWARARLEAAAGARIGIVVPDLATRSAEARRAILGIAAPDWRLASPGELPVNFSYGAPLAATGIVHAALLALRALSGRLDPLDAGQLLRTPYLNGARTEAAARAALDLSLRERVGLSLATMELAAQAAGEAPLFGAQLRALGGNAPRATSQPAAAWAATFDAALRAIGWPGARALGSDEYQALRAWGETLDELRSVDALAGPLSLDEALGLLGELAGARAFQPEGHPGAIQVLGTLEALGQRFDALWISGLSAAAWPPGARPDPLLPLSLQRELGMPDATPALTRERAERLLRRLQGSASEVVVSYPEHAGDEALAPSPLIASLPARSRAELPLWDGPERRDVIAASGAAELLAADPAPRVTAGEALRGGAALLERQARCPARAFIEFRLGARELRKSTAGIDARLRGAILHGVLHDVMCRLGGHSGLLGLDAAGEEALLEAVIRRRLAGMLPLADPFVWRLAREEDTRLRRLAAEFLRLERLRPPFTVVATEGALPPAAAPAPLAALGISVRPDRVDEFADGRRIIIDYKTSAELPAHADLVGARPRAPQLPLYASLTGAAAIALVQVGAAGVRCLAVGEESVPFPGLLAPAELTGGAAADWKQLRAQWSAELAQLAAELLAGDFRVGRRREEAGGEWAMATRIHELADEEGEP